MSEISSNRINDYENNLPEDLIEIRDPEIDAQKIMSEIRARMERRRKELGYERMRFPTFGDVLYPGRPADIPYDPDLYHHLKLVNRLYTDVETEPSLEPSPTLRIPIIGRVWRLIRGEAHNLVLFYVNRAINHDIAVNRHLISVVNLLTADSQRQEREIKALSDEINKLRAKIDD